MEVRLSPEIKNFEIRILYRMIFMKRMRVHSRIWSVVQMFQSSLRDTFMLSNVNGETKSSLSYVGGIPATALVFLGH